MTGRTHGFNALFESARLWHLARPSRKGPWDSQAHQQHEGLRLTVHGALEQEA